MESEFQTPQTSPSGSQPTLTRRLSAAATTQLPQQQESPLLEDEQQIQLEPLLLSESSDSLLRLNKPFPLPPRRPLPSKPQPSTELQDIPPYAPPPKTVGDFVYNIMVLPFLQGLGHGLGTAAALWLLHRLKSRFSQ